MLKVAIIGFGGIAKAVHLKPHLELEKEGITKLVAVCDVDETRFGKKLEINIDGSDSVLPDSVKRYTDYKEMLEKEDLDMVDICVPTFLHAEVSGYAMNAGVHVLCEKPMGLNYDLCKSMIETSKATGKKLMIGQCLRFEPAYLYLKELFDTGKYGKVVSGVFNRLSTVPSWGWENWFLDYECSGGAILDMQVHDTDIIRYIFGNPKSVSCFTHGIYSKVDIAHSHYIYDDYNFTAIGDWSREGTSFEESFIVAFEKATVKFYGGKVTVYVRGEKTPIEVELQSVDAYRDEIRYFVDCIINDKENTKNEPEDCAASVKLVYALLESSDKNGAVVPFNA